MAGRFSCQGILMIFFLLTVKHFFISKPTSFLLSLALVKIMVRNKKTHNFYKNREIKMQNGTNNRNTGDTPIASSQLNYPQNQTQTQQPQTPTPWPATPQPNFTPGGVNLKTPVGFYKNQQYRQQREENEDSNVTTSCKCSIS